MGVEVSLMLRVYALYGRSKKSKLLDYMLRLLLAILMPILSARIPDISLHR